MGPCGKNHFRKLTNSAIYAVYDKNVNEKNV